jgi:FAD/FMN-containing dehydrogenase
VSKFSTVATDEFVNWSGGLRFTPQRFVTPQDDEALRACILEAAERGDCVRAAGSGHSSSPLVRTQDVVILLEKFRGLIEHDAQRCQAVVGAGTPLRELGALLHAVGLGMENLGDVDTQTIAGVVSTGTHGSGRTLQNISAKLVGARLITGAGEMLEWSVEDAPERVQALRVSIGSLGVLTALRLQLEPAYRLRRREYCAHVEDCLAHLDAIADFHRNFDFYWYPRRDDVKIRTLNPPDRPHMDMPFARCVREEEGYSHEIIAQTRELRFEEVEYFVRADAGPDCFRAVRRRILERHRQHVGWRVLYRLIAADDGWLSPVYDRDSAAISIHQNATLPYQEYFDDIEPVLRDHGGRPHWGKRHSMHGAQLANLYPQWQRFMALRRELDPQGVLLSQDLAHLFAEEARA